MVSISSKSDVFEFSGGQKPPLGGLLLICDAHLQTRMSYSSQKSCVKIRFGLIEIGGMLIFGGGGGGGFSRSNLLGGIKCDLRCPFSNLAELFQSKVMCENLVWIG